MSKRPEAESNRHSPYGSAKDLPSYQELAQQLHDANVLRRFIAREQRQQILDLQRQLERLTRVVDDFYERLGSRNWIFHDSLSVDKVEMLLADALDPESAERELIALYRDNETIKWLTMRLRNQEGLRERNQQIERARQHYSADQFDSCVLHLIAVMDGFVNDFQPSERRGLHSRDPDEMVAWDSVVGHHLGLTHALKTFKKTIKKRVDEEVFDVHRHGIMHGMVVNFDNVTVATKAWNMLFAVSDWANATRKAAQVNEAQSSWKDLWTTLTRWSAYKKSESEFTPYTLTSSNAKFKDSEVVQRTMKFLDAWHHGRWNLVAAFAPPKLRSARPSGQCARETKEIFERYKLGDWQITSVHRDQVSSADVSVSATVNGAATELRLRMVSWTATGELAIPSEGGATWHIAIWAPHTYFQSDT